MLKGHRVVIPFIFFYTLFFFLKVKRIYYLSYAFLWMVKYKHALFSLIKLYNAWVIAYCSGWLCRLNILIFLSSEQDLVWIIVEITLRDWRENSS
jgi:hypothetical protein